MSSEIKILFYIIVGIIYLISTFYRREKKKQDQRDVNRKPVDTKTAGDIFEELKRSILQPELSIPKKQPMEKKPFIKMERKPEIVVNYNDYRKKEKKPLENTFTEEPHFEHHKEIEIQDMIETKEIKSEIDFEETDPRKAFIFGEIFRRPQY